MTVRKIFSRRRILKFGTTMVVAGLTAAPTQAFASLPRRLAFDNLHTGEKLRTEYWADGQYLPSSCKEINHVLRDHRSGEEAEISTKLLDLLHAIQTRLGTTRPFEVISGYRSSVTNAVLARAGSGVATNSLHMQGLAIDVHVPERPLAQLRDAALSLQGGGVGFYPKSNFVHVDVGRVRRW